MEGRIRLIKQYVAAMASVFSENTIKPMFAEKKLLADVLFTSLTSTKNS